MVRPFTSSFAQAIFYRSLDGHGSAEKRAHVADILF